MRIWSRSTKKRLLKKRSYLKMERVIKANKDNDLKFLSGMETSTTENYEQATEMLAKFNESGKPIKNENVLEYFTE